MLTHEDNELITHVGAGTPMGNTMRRYWIPALLAWEFPEPDCPPVRVKLLGEDLVAFRDTEGRVGLLDELCPHRRASLYFGRNEECGLRCVSQDRGIQESMGRIVDRSKEHLGPADKAIIQARRLLLEAVKTVQEGGAPHQADLLHAASVRRRGAPRCRLAGGPHARDGHRRDLADGVGPSHRWGIALRVPA